mmetsp:Transcript_8776/g.21345  ORF Transcript_8776/g.21345 Transcript_8776/m.21345 type:complete len:206 (-) Transcript_8776:1966-2583(-)
MKPPRTILVQSPFTLTPTFKMSSASKIRRSDAGKCAKCRRWNNFTCIFRSNDACFFLTSAGHEYLASRELSSYANCSSATCWRWFFRYVIFHSASTPITFTSLFRRIFLQTSSASDSFVMYWHGPQNCSAVVCPAAACVPAVVARRFALRRMLLPVLFFRGAGGHNVAGRAAAAVWSTRMDGNGRPRGVAGAEAALPFFRTGARA